MLEAHSALIKTALDAIVGAKVFVKRDEAETWQRGLVLKRWGPLKRLSPTCPRVAKTRMGQAFRN